MITEKEILAKLTSIIDPDFNQDIVSLGFVKNIKVEEGNVAFDIELTTPACPIKAEFQQKAESAVKSLPGVGRVNVNMTSASRSQPVSSPELEKSTLKSVRSIIAVSSCKGGVGKSTLAATMALELAQRGFKVGLVDTDIYGPSVPSLFNLYNVQIFVNAEQQFIPLEAGPLKLMSFGFLLGDAPAVLRGPIATRYIQQLLHNTAWGELDYLFIDMPPGTGDVQLTITQSCRISGAIIVTTKQTLSLVDVARGILMFEKVNVPMLGMIDNMAYFICDQCQKKHFIFGGNEQTRLEERFGIPVLAEVPILGELTQKIEKSMHNEYIKHAVDQSMRALGKLQITQKQVPAISFDDQMVTLKWEDGSALKVSNRDLRLSCSCALCVNELTGKKLLQPESLRPDIKPKEIFPLGNYAIGVNWNDGHSSGIYPYKNIREIAAAK